MSIDSETTSHGKVGNFRRNLPQIMACLSMNTLMLSVGLSIGYPTIAINVYVGLEKEKYPNQTLILTHEESSWLGSLMFMSAPISSVLYGFLSDHTGCKGTLMMAAVMSLFGWLIFYFGNNIEILYIAAILQGLGAGLNSSIYAYCGEVTEPKIRGLMLSITTLSNNTGVCLMYVLGAFFTLPTAQMFGVVCTLITLMSLVFIPESPQWLISKNNINDAEKSLQWLRGWTSSKNVTKELAELKTYIAEANACLLCQRNKDGDKGPCNHKSNYFEKVKDLGRRKSLQPMILLLFCMSICQFNGIIPIRPYLPQVFNNFGVPIASQYASILIGLGAIVATIILVVTVPWFGNRKVILVGIGGVVICCFGLAINAYLYIKIDQTTFVPASKNPVGSNIGALFLFFFVSIFGYMSYGISWMMNSEVFPFRIRGTATGLTAANAYMTTFWLNKTYINVEKTFSIFGIFTLYSSISLVGFIVLFVILPDTEGHSLEEIEQFFSDKTRKITDLKIGKTREAKVTFSRLQGQEITKL